MCLGWCSEWFSYVRENEEEDYLMENEIKNRSIRDLTTFILENGKSDSVNWKEFYSLVSKAGMDGCMYEKSVDSDVLQSQIKDYENNPEKYDASAFEAYVCQQVVIKFVKFRS